ncbi:uncharacterized protein LOC112462533 [Temnothorax curvispinosus]|uniref:Uncharacterized protein LOC112462533 n=1 Tax=Temnothorax curvispinosus TaxID=300111 RepID=A0A6J1QNS7_9HYME|nr:uncharacterized protein LOC112462533 [Temnothorax curvispinosus]
MNPKEGQRIDSSERSHATAAMTPERSHLLLLFVLNKVGALRLFWTLTERDSDDQGVDSSAGKGELQRLTSVREDRGERSNPMSGAFDRRRRKTKKTSLTSNIAQFIKFFIK